jgi:23S rRNA G2445 N2-methylase RlmL
LLIYPQHHPIVRIGYLPVVIKEVHKTVSSSLSFSYLLVCNPPWGIRLNDNEDGTIHDAWESLRIFLRETCPPATQVWLVCGNKQLTKHLGRQRRQSIRIETGEQDLRFL